MLNESTLIQKLQNGDSTALSALYDRYSGALYGVLLRMCKNEPMAQDALQETFLKIWRNCGSYDPEKGKFYTWAYRIARNTALNALRNPSKLIQTEDLSVYTNEAEEEAPDIDLIQLNGSLRQLEAHHQKALELVYFQGLTHREAHEEMEVPLGTFKSYIKQALKKLRESYQMALVLGGLLMKWIV
ncbi:MAG: sigma-70 family RNA polymerase sigma factor [Bacteroidota bacterium]